MKVIGLKISPMVEVSRFLKMDLYMKVISLKALKQVKVNTTGPIRPSIKASGKIINLKVMENTIGLMVVSIMVSGLKI